MFNFKHIFLFTILLLILSSCGSSAIIYDPRYYFLKSDIFYKEFKMAIKGINISQKDILKIAKSYKGIKYIWGGANVSGFDCSGYTKFVYKKKGISIPRNSKMQSKFGEFVPKNKLLAGDLIFFDTSKAKKGTVTHVGIYIGDNKFVHASSTKKKVIVSSLAKPFYQQRFRLARRVINVRESKKN